MRGAQGDRNRKLNLILNEYEFAVERIRDLYGSALTKENLKAKLDEYFHVQGLVKFSIAELSGMILGVGSVTDAAALQHMLFGANFVVTPVFRKQLF